MSALAAGHWSLAAASQHGKPQAHHHQQHQHQQQQQQQQRDLVFVKLTDSALRAIEDFLANKDKHRTAPTIQFLAGSEGNISIPNLSSADSHTTTNFRFSLSNNADHEGPQSSFECLQTGSGKSLRTLGSIPTRMRVQANDDVYETTKHRMAVDAENLKSKCTRVIKHNPTDIGRKIKVKQHRPPPPRPPNVISQSSYNNQVSHNNYQTTGMVNGYGGSGGGLYNHQSSNGNSINHNGNANTYNNFSAGRTVQNKPTSQSGNPELQRRPIKERLIQLLALKPYKKPELYARLNSEGLKEKEKSVIPSILQQISQLKDNCYQLHRHLWNDVNEEWPYYSEEEKQVLKRRKPQNLTPPLSSDSGHSPSPPPGKRSSASQQTSMSSGQPPIKKQRISHYKKTQDAPRESGEGSPAALSNGYHSSTSTSGASSGERKNYSDEDTPPSMNSLTPSKRENGFSLNYGTAKNFIDVPQQNGYQASPPSTVSHLNTFDVTSKAPSPASLDKRLSPVQINGGSNPQRREKKSPDSTTLLAHSPALVQPLLPDNSIHIPDYETHYIEITCPEQRRKYKSEFAEEYKEYMDLHSRIEAVAHRFSILEERLNGEKPGGMSHREIKRQIVEEYQKMQQQHQRDLDKFKYLHLKLAHIKRLVGEYDHRMQATAY